MVLDLQPYLSDPSSWAAEKALYKEMFDAAGILIVPGSDCRFDRPGYFRLVFTQVSVPTLKEGLSRLTAFLKTKN